MGQCYITCAVGASSFVLGIFVIICIVINVFCIVPTATFQIFLLLSMKTWIISRKRSTIMRTRNTTIASEFLDSGNRDVSMP